ncbi:3-oxoacyl-[acyl-carrier protein] reductase [[Actinomadura] parvosata subsp. kistnae]|uniref:Short-chain dehydrogenase n=1 Tax=[Actinomadura] parvosata subsp. kistnae TaxID=1909395 RepID=A0A1U9ZTE4_9ACTN|nr:SDR family oxidoreductase [Nonomuraea sp. ATCC 55076]AQZ61240.1 short-chain dehydrogenase [Nonomuraea sp. ATCC 55076]SPL97880.1 3-oxoacyl-[acyl-carrier protein] reductase [Actinomadura parvosata subsp. kistnae]
MERIALITGAGRGIGAATARELARRGFHAIVNYRTDTAAAASVVKSIEAAGGTARAVRADVRDPGDVAGLVGACPRVDALVCNANISPPFAPLAELSWTDFAGKVTGELAAVFHVTQRVLPLLRERRGGRIVYVSSVSAGLARPVAIAHGTAKAALDSFARHVAAEAGAWGTTVNVVAPGAVRTEGSAAMRTPEAERSLAERSVLGRMTEPEDVAAVIGALVDGGFGAVTGAHIPVDAGARLIP